jgi:hypothetical protein
LQVEVTAGVPRKFFRKNGADAVAATSLLFEKQRELRFGYFVQEKKMQVRESA